MSEVNHERLLRAIRCLQLIQRSNAPKSSIFKACAKALVPLMNEQSTLPPLPARPSRAKRVQPPILTESILKQGPGELTELFPNADAPVGSGG